MGGVPTERPFAKTESCTPINGIDSRKSEVVIRDVFDVSCEDVASTYGLRLVMLFHAFVILSVGRVRLRHLVCNTNLQKLITSVT